MTKLVRGLGPWGAASLVVGTIIGTGVFLKTATMAQLGGSSAWVLVAWAVAGALSLTGAMTYAELGAMFPHAGGEYVYLRRGYGPAVGYLCAWNRFWIGTPASIAAYAVGSAAFINAAVPLGGFETLVAIGFVVMFTTLNLMNVRSGGQLMTAMTVMKVLMIGVIIIGAFFAPRGDVGDFSTGTGEFPGWSAFGAMMIAALWAYDGWNNLPMAAGEVRDPQRNLPRALLLGTLGVFVIYALVNLAYFYALPFDEVVTSRSNAYENADAVAAKASREFLGTTAAALLAIAMTLSALSAMNGSMLTGARVPYAAARDNLAPKLLAHVSDESRVPTVAVLVQGILAIGLALSGKFDQLTDMVVFASWIFYALNAGTVLILRVREPERPRPFRTPGYPVVPIVFIAVAVLLLVNTVYTTFWPSIYGLAINAVGALVYFAFYRGRAAPLDEEAQR